MAVSEDATALPPGPISFRTMSSLARFALAKAETENAPATSIGCGSPQPAPVLPVNVPPLGWSSASSLTSLLRYSTSPLRASTNER